MEDLIQGKDKVEFLKALKKAARSKPNNIFVVPTRGKYGVKWTLGSRYFRLLKTQQEALKIAKEYAKSKNSESVVVFNDFLEVKKIIKNIPA